MIFLSATERYTPDRRGMPQMPRGDAFHVRYGNGRNDSPACLQHQPRSRSCLPNFLILRIFPKDCAKLFVWSTGLSSLACPIPLPPTCPIMRANRSRLARCWTRCALKGNRSIRFRTITMNARTPFVGLALMRATKAISAANGLRATILTTGVPCSGLPLFPAECMKNPRKCAWVR